MSPARAELLDRLCDALKALYEYDRVLDGKKGSPDPTATAMAQTLVACLTYVRIAVAHRVVDAGFEYIVEMARELEVDGWAEHRKHCVTCGGH